MALTSASVTWHPTRHGFATDLTAVWNGVGAITAGLQIGAFEVQLPQRHLAAGARLNIRREQGAVTARAVVAFPLAGVFAAAQRLPTNLSAAERFRDVTGSLVAPWLHLIVSVG